MEESVSSCLGCDEPSGAVDSYMNRSGGVGDSGERVGVEAGSCFSAYCCCVTLPRRPSDDSHSGPSERQRPTARRRRRREMQQPVVARETASASAVLRGVRIAAPRDERAALITSCRKRSEQGRGVE